MSRILTVSMALTCTLSAVADEPKDKFQYLEEVTGDKPLAWVKERNAASTGELTKTPEFEALDERLLKILDSKERIPAINKAGKWFYNFWRDDKNKRGLWRRTTLDEYRKDQPNWETVLDLDKLAADEKENWVWGGANFLNPEYERCLISVSRGGADAKVIREFDVIKKEFVKGGFTLPEAKSVVSWRDLDRVYVATDYGPGSLTTSGYPRITKEWKRGTPLSEAKLVYEGKPTDMRAFAYWDRTPGFVREFASRRVTFYSGETFVRRGEKFVKIDKPDDAEASVHRDLIFFTLRTEWKVGGKTYPAGALLSADFEKFMDSDRTFDVVFEPTARKSLAGFTATKTKFVLNELDNVVNKLSLLTREGASGTASRSRTAPYSS